MGFTASEGGSKNGEWRIQQEDWLDAGQLGIYSPNGDYLKIYVNYDDGEKAQKYANKVNKFVNDWYAKYGGHEGGVEKTEIRSASNPEISWSDSTF